jgi:hypothetical protein
MPLVRKYSIKEGKVTRRRTMDAGPGGFAEALLRDT